MSDIATTLQHYSSVDNDMSLVDWTEEARACITVQGLMVLITYSRLYHTICMRLSDQTI